MHHFIYPQQDTYITNRTVYPNKNFGLDESLLVGTKNTTGKFTIPTRDFYVIDQVVSNLCVSYFTGNILTGSIHPTNTSISGTIATETALTLYTDYFSGSIMGDYTGWINGIATSASMYTGTLVHFSGTIVTYDITTFDWNEIESLYNSWSYAWNYASTLSGSVYGVVSGSFSTTDDVLFSGDVTGFNGAINYGILTGIQSISQSHEDLITTKHINRTLVKFDIDAVSASVAAGEIPMPDFKLRLNVSRAEELPIQYTIFALPISQSWTMGNGYFSDEGSDKGASWNYRNYVSGSAWYNVTDTSSFTPIDFIYTSSNAPLVWSRGGGTWYTNSIASQSFDYVTGDVDMNVTSIVTRWISGSIPNNGFILISSDELQSTGSEMGLYFFSKDSNTIFQPILDVGWNDVTWTTGSISTASVTIVNLPAGLLGDAQAGSTISGSSVNGGFNGTVNLVTTSSGAMTGTGFSGSIKAMSFYGNITYVLSSSIHASISQSLILGNLTSGQFSSSIFTASLNNYVIFGGQMTGSWNNSQLSGSQIIASYPFDIAPNIIVTISGNQVSGHALGTWQTASLTSGSFTGIMTDGAQAGANVHIPFTGSILTASYAYTGSVVLESSSLSPVQFSKPFVTVIQDLPEQTPTGNIIRVNVFAREEFPFKNFQRRTQFTQHLSPQYLPTSSYYAIKDNETEMTILGFDNNTKLSCDAKGNYFLLDTTGLPQERYIRVLIKTEQSGSVYTFDRDDVVKIVR